MKYNLFDVFLLGMFFVLLDNKIEGADYGWWVVFLPIALPILLGLLFFRGSKDAT